MSTTLLLLSAASGAAAVGLPIGLVVGRRGVARVRLVLENEIDSLNAAVELATARWQETAAKLSSSQTALRFANDHATRLRTRVDDFETAEKDRAARRSAIVSKGNRTRFANRRADAGVPSA